jgi:hypothetical protein
LRNKPINNLNSQTYNPDSSGLFYQVYIVHLIKFKGATMTVHLALKTQKAIDLMLETDQGATYRQTLGRVIPYMGDAFRGADEVFRSHIGASMIGRKCARAIWYGFRWVKKPRFPARILRLFNRGHLEEARFIALLLSIGVKVFQQDANGNQFRISELGGHFGGSGDGVGLGVPDIPADQYCVLEFKTHSRKSFDKLVKEGVKKAKPEHFTQMQTYMRKMAIGYALYGAVCKDDDDIYWEIVTLDPIHADEYIQRGRTIVLMRTPPDKISQSPGWFECKYCEYKTICHGGSSMEMNCRTCRYSEALPDGSWLCNKHGHIMSKTDQLAGCTDHVEIS